MRTLEVEQEGSNEEQPEDMVSEDVVNMAMAVALEMEEKRRAEEWEKMELENKKKEAQRLQTEADDLAREADRSELSLDELTTLRQLEAKLGVGYGQSQGPCIPVAAQGQRAVLDAYWEFVRENPQDFNGWAYLIQACETVDILDEIRTVYNAFLPLFPYCYAYWKRYSDIERKSENWQIDCYSYDWKKLDPTSDDTKAQVKQYFTHDESSKDLEGRAFNQGMILK